ncbi:MAG TPA: sigma-70 family RNA polymerase sigma factor [Spirochaetia bacterium]|nr:sigma-70 family RNA polymerase sigma factor [Spirochaetia bacterium]
MTGSERQRLAEAFEGHRPYLRSVAYRILGSLTEAEDAIQECWIRLDRADAAEIVDLRGWLTTALARICLDILRRRRSHREEYPGTWLPEPILDERPGGNPEQESVLSESIGLALLIVLENLTPLERLTFVLHDVFAVPFHDVGKILGRSTPATRQLARRARHHIRTAAPSPDADPRVQRRMIDAFLAATRSGNFDALFDILAPDVVLRADVGAAPGAPRRGPLVGVDAVVDHMRRNAKEFATYAHHIFINGVAGLLVQPPAARSAAVSFTVAAGRITAIDIIGQPKFRLSGPPR